jgi:hypothetical protein
MSLSFYQERLTQLMQVPNPSFLMKRVIDTLRSDTEKVYIYDLHPSYASLFLSDDTRSIYFYPNLECSLLKPPEEHYTPHWNKWIDTSNAPVLDLEWIHSILNKGRELDVTVTHVPNVTNVTKTDSKRLLEIDTCPMPVIVMKKINEPSTLHSPKQLNYIKKINSILSGKPPRINLIKGRPVWK